MASEEVDLRTDQEPSLSATAGRQRGWVIIPLFAATSFVGASTLFVVQPLVARLILPQYGGSATVWSTSNLFFQVVLLIGYLYAHATVGRLGPRWQPILHLAVLLLPLAALPIVLPPDAAPDAGTSPALWLLRTLLLLIGLPFAVISATGPLLQRWFSWTGAQRSEDPYFLYATSNLGSFAGLLAYPLLVEPFLTMDQQRIAWSWSFGLFLLLMATCGLVTFASHRATWQVAPALPPDRLTPRQICHWLLLAFIPSSLMLGVTAHISTDIAAIPLMWVVPLAIYLATFVVAFSRSTRDPNSRTRYWTAVVAVLAAIAYPLSTHVPILLLISIDLLLLGVAAYAAHSTLAALRPNPSHLTFFYLVITVGGALGGLLNGLAAPALFTWVWEYPAIVVATVLLAIGAGSRPWQLLSRRYHPLFVLLLETVASAALLLGTAAGLASLRDTGWVAIVIAATVAIGLLLARRPVPLAIGMAMYLAFLTMSGTPPLYRERTFYGSYQVREEGRVRRFLHGTTLHGAQPRCADADS